MAVGILVAGAAPALVAGLQKTDVVFGTCLVFADDPVAGLIPHHPAHEPNENVRHEAGDGILIPDPGILGWQERADRAIRPVMSLLFWRYRRREHPALRVVATAALINLDFEGNGKIPDSVHPGMMAVPSVTLGQVPELGAHGADRPSVVDVVQ